jgi:ribonuclease Z
MLFDCGEGTQRQMMRYGTGFSLRRIFFTHLHADHFLGVVGLLRTMALQGREEPMDLFGPPGSTRVLNQAIHLGVDRIQFPVQIQELQPGQSLGDDDYEIMAFKVRHGTSAIGYRLKEFPRLGRFDVDRARELGIPEGPLFGRLHRGEAVEVDGRTIRPEELVGPARPGRTLVYTGDTRPTQDTVEAAAGADLLIHEATFSLEDAARAHETFHSTAHGAAEIAAEAGVDALVLTHISARYSENPAPLLKEAREVFANTEVARDGLSLEIAYKSEGLETPDVAGA